MTLSEWYRIYIYRLFLRRLLRRLPTELENVLPYPKEKPDWSLTLEDTTAEEVVSNWLLDYKVPKKYSSFWYGVKVILEYTGKPKPWTAYSPADTIAQERWRRVRLNVAFTNSSGTLAHELAHISRYYLTLGQMADFSEDFHRLRKTDDLLQIAWESSKYMRKNDTEGYADCYRLLGNKMPDALKVYYPKLL